MIVRCDHCQKRFRIADEKVTQRGLTVRCTNCQHTFRIERAIAPGAGSSPDGPTRVGPPPSAALDASAQSGVQPAADDDWERTLGTLTASGRLKRLVRQTWLPAALALSIAGVLLLSRSPSDGAADLNVVDVATGLYDTSSGRPVFFVRGEVENRGPDSGRATVRAEIFQGEQLVSAVEGLAGAPATPEDLFAISSAADVDALSERLRQGAAELAQGARAAFLLVFYEYPPNLNRFHVKVTVRRAGSPR